MVVSGDVGFIVGPVMGGVKEEMAQPELAQTAHELWRCNAEQSSLCEHLTILMQSSAFVFQRFAYLG